MTSREPLIQEWTTRLTYQIACLQHAGLVSRTSVCGDKQGVQVALTERARDRLRETSSLLAGTVRQALSDSVGPDQRAAMCALVPDLEQGADRPASRP
ncbi:hypothetical protein [Streptomyces sp. 2231.1]|uniref:hypothetical protein n=1 Tax=Streptomyces sp. 2231.1 TaxID=1855347 RepID=UPI0035261856